MNDEYFSSPGEVTQSMRDGLARAYGIPGFRDYLLHSIRVANKNAMTCIQRKDTEQAQVFALRMAALEKLAEQCRLAYERYDEIKRQRKAEVDKSLLTDQ